MPLTTAEFTNRDTFIPAVNNSPTRQCIVCVCISSGINFALPLCCKLTGMVLDIFALSQLQLRSSLCGSTSSKAHGRKPTNYLAKFDLLETENRDYNRIYTIGVYCQRSTAIHAKRVTIMKDDMQLQKRLVRDRAW